MAKGESRVGEAWISLSELRQSLIRTAEETAARLTDEPWLRKDLSEMLDLSSEGLRQRVNDGKIPALEIIKDVTGNIDLERTTVAANDAKRFEELVKTMISDAHKRLQHGLANYASFRQSNRGKQHWELLCKLTEIDQGVRELDRAPTTLPSERESKQRQLEHLRRQREDCEGELRGIYNRVGAGRVAPDGPPPASAASIKMKFRVFPDSNKNHEWWTEKMRDAKRYRLADCRVGSGRRGLGGSTWRPDLVAAWLVDRDKKGLEGMSAEYARKALEKFPGCSEIAETLFPIDRQLP